MRKILAVTGTFLFFFVAPGTVAGLLPFLITQGRLETAWFGIARPMGVVLIAIGLVPLVESFGRFALKGLGTPAPILPTRHLVVTGFYRYVRNPMYVGVVAIILGQGLFASNTWLLAYAGGAWLCMNLFVLSYEEPKLQQTFGEEYVRFRANVPRWLPRLRPWES
jgi:protein-S-isoprenylcysteine O-methyltransferase Ste14